MVRSQISARGIRNPEILFALESIPRECFVPASHSSHAYEDKPLPIGCNQTISQPFMVAWMSDLLGVQKGERVFEIGTGSGYQSAVLDFLGAKLLSVEFFSQLHKNAIQNLERWKPGCVAKHQFVLGNAPEFLNADLRFEKMISCAALPEMPGEDSVYFHSLVPGGIFVFPMGKDQEIQILIVAKKTSNGWSLETKGGVKFVPLLGTDF